MGIQDKQDETKKGPSVNMFGSIFGSVGLGVKTQVTKEIKKEEVKA